MSGIVGYIGKEDAHDQVMGGLRRIEYRGYDSGGIAVITSDGKIDVRKRADRLETLVQMIADDPLPAANAGIGHFRWATHGAPNDINAHPHLSPQRTVAVVHNGIIENFAELRDELESEGFEFCSETDSETIAFLIERQLRETSDLGEAVRLVCQRLEGAFAIVVLSAAQPDRVVGARRNSPLLVGLGDGENYFGSDVAGFIDYTRTAVELDQDQIVTVYADRIEIVDLDGASAEVNTFTVDWDIAAAEKGGFEWFMTKEIHEQPAAIADTLLGRQDANGRLQLDEMRLSDSELRDIDKIIIVAAGSSYYTGMVAKYAIEHWTRIPCEVELASEFRYRDPILDRSTLVVAISQSGETMDTLMAIRYAREQRSLVLSICNTNGSTIPRESDAVIYTHAGPEIAVASTKGFLAQVVACYLLALYLAQAKGVKYLDEISGILDQLNEIPAAVESVLEREDEMKELAARLQDASAYMFLGRHVGYPVALEGALKLKETVYVHSEGFAAGEIKHGPIAVIDQGTPVFIIVPPRARDQLQEKIVSNIREVRARGAYTIVLVEEGDDSVLPYADHVFRLPKVPTLLQPLVATVPLQIFACELSALRGYDVDRPRNLAKAVTVE